MIIEKEGVIRILPDGTVDAESFEVRHEDTDTYCLMDELRRLIAGRVRLACRRLLEPS